MASELAGWNHTRARGVREAGTWGRRPAYLFTTQLPWTSIATFWTPRRTATESVEGPRRLIKLAKGMTFTEEGGRGAVSQGTARPPCAPQGAPRPAGLPARRPAPRVGGGARTVSAPGIVEDVPAEKTGCLRGRPTLLRPRDVSRLTHGHQARKWQSQGGTPGYWGSASTHFRLCSADHRHLSSLPGEPPLSSGPRSPSGHCRRAAQGPGLACEAQGSRPHKFWP